MGLWFETIWILLIAVSGVLAGRWASKQPAARITAMAVSFAIIGLILLARQSVLWNLCPPLRPIAAGRLRFIMLIFAVTLGLTTPLNQLHSYISRFVTCTVMGVFIAVLVTLPFMGPALVQEDLAGIPTRMDLNGVCRQSQPFTCGPAAAVTALKHFGLDATEAQLAVAARTSPIIGTSPWNLYEAVTSIYKGSGLQCSFRYLDTLDAAPADSVVLVVVKDALFTDHCVAVMKYDDRSVTIADPIAGMILMTRGQFKQQWRNCGIVLQRPL